MAISSGTMSAILVIASLGVNGLLFHYLRRVGRLSADIVCVQGLFACAFGLLGTGIVLRRAQDYDLFTIVCLGLALCFAALSIWQQSLRRARNAG